MKTVLIVEDSPSNLMAGDKTLTKAGYTVYTAHDGIEALFILSYAFTTIDVVVTDIMMPNLNGIELIKRMKKDERYKHIPIIALSATREEARCKVAGATKFFMKPYKQQELLDYIDNMLLS